MGFVSNIANNVAGQMPQPTTAPRQTPPQQTAPGQVMPGQVAAQHIANPAGGKGGIPLAPPAPYLNQPQAQPELSAFGNLGNTMMPGGSPTGAPNIPVAPPMGGKGGVPTGQLPLAPQNFQPGASPLPTVGGAPSPYIGGRPNTMGAMPMVRK